MTIEGPEQLYKEPLWLERDWSSFGDQLWLRLRQETLPETILAASAPLWEEPLWRTVWHGWSCQEPLGSFATGAAITQSSGNAVGSRAAAAGTLKKLWDQGSSEKIRCRVTFVTLATLNSAGSGAVVFRGQSQWHPGQLWKRSACGRNLWGCCVRDLWGQRSCQTGILWFSSQEPLWSLSSFCSNSDRNTL